MKGAGRVRVGHRHGALEAHLHSVHSPNKAVVKALSHHCVILGARSSVVGATPCVGEGKGQNEIEPCRAQRLNVQLRPSRLRTRSDTSMKRGGVGRCQKGSGSGAVLGGLGDILRGASEDLLYAATFVACLVSISSEMRPCSVKKRFRKLEIASHSLPARPTGRGESALGRHRFPDAASALLVS